jgi:hypothetical protein
VKANRIVTLFAPDLYRNFIIGFLGGSLIIAAGLVEGVGGFGAELHSQARASETTRQLSDDLDISKEFLIQEVSAEPRK